LGEGQRPRGPGSVHPAAREARASPAIAQAPRPEGCCS
jgi:hypothetical protein